MQVITTKFLGPTYARGSRIKASMAAMGTGNSSLTVAWDHELNVEGNHDRAARALAEKMEFHGIWHKGEQSSGNVYVRDLGYADTSFSVMEG